MRRNFAVAVVLLACAAFAETPVRPHNALDTVYRVLPWMRVVHR